MPARKAIDTAKDAYRTFKAQNVQLLAASVAFFAFFSLLSMILLALAIGSLLNGQAIADRIIDTLQAHLGQAGEQVIRYALETPAGQGGATLLGTLALLWSGLRVLRTIDLAFDSVYQGQPDPGIIKQATNALTALAAILLAILLLIALEIILRHPLLAHLPLQGLTGWLASMTIIVALFLAFYRIMPPIPVTFKEILPGTLLATTGWLLLHIGFRAYAQQAARYEALGLLGAVLLFLTWLYLASLLILTGATINATLAQPNDPKTHT